MSNRKSYFTLVSIIFCTAFFACESQQTVEVPIGRELLEPAQDADGAIKILIYYDMEGVSGQNLIKSLDFGNDEYFKAREWLTNDVNAVIEGLFAGGADAVDVVDAHGSGNPEPDILLDKMDPRAKMIYRDNPFRPYVDLVEPEIFEEFGEQLFADWIEVESGNWKPPVPREKEAPSKKYFGAN